MLSWRECDKQCGDRLVSRWSPERKLSLARGNCMFWDCWFGGNLLHYRVVKGKTVRTVIDLSVGLGRGCQNACLLSSRVCCRASDALPAWEIEVGVRFLPKLGEGGVAARRIVARAIRVYAQRVCVPIWIEARTT